MNKKFIAALFSCALLIIVILVIVSRSEVNVKNEITNESSDSVLTEDIFSESNLEKDTSVENESQNSIDNNTPDATPDSGVTVDESNSEVTLIEDDGDIIIIVPDDMDMDGF